MKAKKKGSKKCLCSQCHQRFYCFTNMKVFSDPILQALFESMMAANNTVDGAIEEIQIFLKERYTIDQKGCGFSKSFIINVDNAKRIMSRLRK